jgi:hypothetical protein
MMPLCFISEMMTDRYGAGWYVGGRMTVNLVNVLWQGETVTARGIVRDLVEEGAAHRANLQVWCEKLDGTKIVVLGYPRVFSGTSCFGTLGLSSTEETKANQLSDALDTVIATTRPPTASPTRARSRRSPVTPSARGRRGSTASTCSTRVRATTRTGTATAPVTSHSSRPSPADRCSRTRRRASAGAWRC